MYDSRVSFCLLFHFTKDINSLMSILENGFWPMTSIEDISFMMPNYKKARIGIPMVCFTNIPLELSIEHRKEYGQFGIGMRKKWGIQNGLNPISYIVKGSENYKAFNHLQCIAQQNALQADGNVIGKQSKEVMDAVMNCAGFLKEYSRDEMLNYKPYYDEREWRYMPPFADSEVGQDGCYNRLLLEDVDDDEKKRQLNERMKKRYTLKFETDDIEKIVLPLDYDVFSFVKLLENSGLSDFVIDEYISKIKF